MNKRVFGRKLSRSRPAREALFASLSQALIINGKIVTTRAKAKAVAGSVEKLVTLAKAGSIAARRKAMSKLDNARDATDILFQKIAKVFSAKNSGFTRIISLPRRVGDNAQMVRMEWTEKMEISDKKLEVSKQSLPSDGEKAGKKETKKTKTEKIEKTAKKTKS